MDDSLACFCFHYYYIRRIEKIKTGKNRIGIVPVDYILFDNAFGRIYINQIFFTINSVSLYLISKFYRENHQLA